MQLTEEQCIQAVPKNQPVYNTEKKRFARYLQPMEQVFASGRERHQSITLPAYILIIWGIMAIIAGANSGFGILLIGIVFLVTGLCLAIAFGSKGRNRFYAVTNYRIMKITDEELKIYPLERLSAVHTYRRDERGSEQNGDITLTLQNGSVIKIEGIDRCLQLGLLLRQLVSMESACIFTWETKGTKAFRK